MNRRTEIRLLIRSLMINHLLVWGCGSAAVWPALRQGLLERRCLDHQSTPRGEAPSFHELNYLPCLWPNLPPVTQHLWVMPISEKKDAWMNCLGRILFSFQFWGGGLGPFLNSGGLWGSPEAMQCRTLECFDGGWSLSRA